MLFHRFFEAEIMAAQTIAAAMARIQNILQKRPEFGLQQDAPATARWERGLRVISSHANGTRVVSDMPAELGGSGEQVTPGWLMRAGLASCAATRIAMAAAAEGIDLSLLEVTSSSRSDARGLFGIADVNGDLVDAGPHAVELQVRIEAPGVTPERLRSLVETSHRCSPVSSALVNRVPIALRIEAGSE
jgi:uncharacterized OsmC-like protein